MLFSAQAEAPTGQLPGYEPITLLTLLTGQEVGPEVTRPPRALDEVGQRCIADCRRGKADALDAGRGPLGQVAEQTQRRDLGDGPAQGVAAQDQPAARGCSELVQLLDVDGTGALEEATMRRRDTLIEAGKRRKGVTGQQWCLCQQQGLYKPQGGGDHLRPAPHKKAKRGDAITLKGICTSPGTLPWPHTFLSAASASASAQTGW